MTVFCIILLSLWNSVVDTRFNLHKTDDHSPSISYSTFDCLFFNSIDYSKDKTEYWIRRYHIIPYCRRPDQEESIEKSLDVRGASFSFNDLYKKGVTSLELLSWFAPYDVAENYEKTRGKYSNETFNNCSSPWFGSHCQYKFEDNTFSSFDAIVRGSFKNRVDKCFDSYNGACYSFLSTCYRGPSPICLDWREICDGKFDCHDGEDEQFCDQLELNECSPGEYRCHYGGQCIPLIFLRDGLENVDCLDGSDEQDYRILDRAMAFHIDCQSIPLFQCEERTCRYQHSITCGDGECIPRHPLPGFFGDCNNRKLRKHYRLLLRSNNDCKQSLVCLLGLSTEWNSYCSSIVTAPYSLDLCNSLASKCQSETVGVPEHPTLFGFFQLIYFTNRSIDEFKENILPDFVCFDSNRCPGLLQFIVVINLENGLTCSHRNYLPGIIQGALTNYFYEMETLFEPLEQRCLTIGHEQTCIDPSLFHCAQSMKCISYHRLVDGVHDCFFNEDESYPTCLLNDTTRFTCASNTTICLSSIARDNFLRDCPQSEDESPHTTGSMKKTLPLPYIRYCNNRRDGLPISSSISEVHNFTFNEFDSTPIDEFFCDYWPCNTPYVQCDNTWDCPNGIDELNCPDNSCPSNQHQCNFRDSNDIICLPIEHLYDEKTTNCLPDNRVFSRRVYFDNRTNVIKKGVSWSLDQCITRHQVCDSNPGSNMNNGTPCTQDPHFDLFIEDSITLYDGHNLCDSFTLPLKLPLRRFFSTYHFDYVPPVPTVPSEKQNKQIDSNIFKDYIIDDELNFYCNRGIFVRYGSNGTKKCLCPPSSFGDRCQWQNQRVSLTIQPIFRSVTSRTRIFQIIFMLVDQNGRIAPNIEQLTFVPAHDCETKYNLYLLYPNRPKHLSNNYSVRIDVFDRLKLGYYISWHLSIPFPFLPVNRLAARLIIPDQVEVEYCSLDCGYHGRCQRYANNRRLFFCQCDTGYYGLTCNQSHQCLCNKDAHCLASSHCLCPLNRFGRHCFLEHSICSSNKNPCGNHGFCVPGDAHFILQKAICVCQKGYTGERCEKRSNYIEIVFDQQILATMSSVIIHLITAFNNRQPERITLFKKIPITEKSVAFYHSEAFNILFIELFNHTYYLAILRETFIPEETIYTQLNQSQRCPSAKELWNESWSYSPIWLRVKYFPLLCRQHQQLTCFYDETHMCICDSDHFANCFEYNHNMTYDCNNWNVCENNAQCFLNNETCPTTIICTCPSCFFGNKCQFSTRGYVFSFDSIMGYHVKPDVGFHRQSLIVKVTIAITLIILVVGVIGASLSIMTFLMERPRKFGCGWYFLASSIISLITIVLLNIKVWIFVLSQMNLIGNRNFLKINCTFTDVILRTLIASNDWLTTCVAIERLMTVRQGVAFNQKKSQLIAKRMIFTVVCLTAASHIHDPIYRRLVDDSDVGEQRTWCLVRYTSFLDWFDSAIMFFHFLTPTVINISAVIQMIRSIAHSRFSINTKKSLQQHFIDRLSLHKNLLITPLLLILLSVPRVIIPFLIKCMKTPREPSLYLAGYFISYSSVILSFFIYVLPSDTFKEDFYKAVQLLKRRVTCSS